MTARFVFRQPNSPRELCDLFRLRHRLIRQERHHRVLPDPDDPLATDGWDLRSLHYGLYRSRRGGHDVCLGYQRGVSLDPTLAPAMVAAPATAAAPSPCSAPLPILATFDGDAHRRLESVVARALDGGERVVEGSLMVIHPAARATLTGRFHVESGLAAYLFHHGFDLGLVYIYEHHQAAYRRWGFRGVLDESAFSPRHELKAVPMMIRRADLRGTVRRRIERYAAQLASTGCCCLEPPAALEMAA
jgi:hypothetical protein